MFEQILSMTDYEELFKASIDKAKKCITGISQISMLKMTLAENGQDLHVVYKEDSDKQGWLPRPVLLVPTSAWKKFFTNDQTEFAPQKIKGHPIPKKVMQLSFV